MKVKKSIDHDTPPVSPRLGDEETISCEELEMVFKRVGAKFDYRTVIQKMDANGDGLIEWNEFLDVMSYAMKIGAHHYGGHH